MGGSGVPVSRGGDRTPHSPIAMEDAKLPDYTPTRIDRVKQFSWAGRLIVRYCFFLVVLYKAVHYYNECESAVGADGASINLSSKCGEVSAVERVFAFCHPIVHGLVFVGCTLYSCLRKSNERRILGEALLLVTAALLWRYDGTTHGKYSAIAIVAAEVLVFVIRYLLCYYPYFMRSFKVTRSFADPAFRAELQTGDLILSSSYETFSRIIKFFSMSKYSHSAVVIRDPSPDFLVAFARKPEEATDPNCDHIYILEADSAFFDKSSHAGEDRTGGVQLTPMLDWIKSVKDYDGSKYVVVTRKLIPADPAAFEANLPLYFKWFESMSLKAYEQHKKDLGRALFRANKKDDFSSVFCSELVAGGYKRLGYLNAKIPASNYLPRDFSAGSEKVLQMIGAKFGPETRIIL